MKAASLPGGGAVNRANGEQTPHRHCVWVADVGVDPVDQRDRERLVADADDVRRHIDAGAGEMEVVMHRAVVHDQRVRTRVDVFHLSRRKRPQA